MESIEKQSLFESLPPVRDMAAVTEQYAALFADREDYCVVVLDDDPTGIQTVHGIPVYMNCRRPTWMPPFGMNLCSMFRPIRAAKWNRLAARSTACSPRD